MKRAVLAILCLGLGACALLQPSNPPFEAEPVQSAEQAQDEAQNTADQIRPESRPEQTIVEADATTGLLGRTVASLGNAAEPGMWLKTPLVQEQISAQVFYPATGKSVAVTLIPTDGPAQSGSRLSLQAMRALGAPLTALPEIDVSAG
ncbi:MAG: hypothetical protein AAF601_13585 [Pseudomonadota bacterium]